MDDIFVPQYNTPGWHRFGEQPSSYPAQRSQLTQPRAVANVNYQRAVTVTPTPQITVQADNSSVSAIPANSLDLVPATQPIAPAVVSCQPAPAITPTIAASTPITVANSAEPSARNAWATNVTLFALADGSVFPATQYWRDQDQLWYVSDGDKGTVALRDIDWSATGKLNTARNVRVVLRNAPTAN